MRISDWSSDVCSSDLWRICIALIPTMAAREVMVSSLATVYAVAANDQAAQALSPLLAQDWSLATALALLAWFVYAPQCISTLATIRRETNSWRQADRKSTRLNSSH